ncbi:hypothetical protein J7J55_07165, partial [Candidatus Bipolaricaulota bacterium]|nr:hypothetical protein [Candidatus Bipolaricaulota bacterium]
MKSIELPTGWQAYAASIRQTDTATYALVRGPDGKFLYVEGRSSFTGGAPLGRGYRYPLTPETAAGLR